SVDPGRLCVTLAPDLLRELVGFAQDAAPGLLGGGSDLQPLLLTFRSKPHAEPDALRLHPGEHARPVLLREVQPAETDLDHVDPVVSQGELPVLAGAAVEDRPRPVTLRARGGAGRGGRANEGRPEFPA